MEDPKDRQREGKPSQLNEWTGGHPSKSLGSWPVCIVHLTGYKIQPNCSIRKSPMLRAGSRGHLNLVLVLSYVKGSNATLALHGLQSGTCLDLALQPGVLWPSLMPRSPCP